MAFQLQTQHAYDLSQQVITINGAKLGGFGEDGAVTYAPSSDIIEHSVGADGLVVASRNNDKRIVATVMVREMSNSYTVLWNLLKAQQIGPRFTPLPWYHLDPSNGDVVTDTHALFVNYPEIEKGQTTSDREFQILLPYAAGNMTLGAGLVI